jgi:hypothetical protein
MAWRVELHADFEPAFHRFDKAVQEALAEKVLLLEEFGPQLGRPHADTLNGSKQSNMKELRFNVEPGVWRVAFAFDPRRIGVLLAAGDKHGLKEKQVKKFYTNLIAQADARFDRHLASVKEK